MERISYVNHIAKLAEIIKKTRPAYLFLYTMSYDVAAIVVFSAINIARKFQINLTDHAYWLGRDCFDYCIEFRDYGATISHRFRKIDSEKLIKIPFYPYVDYEAEFLGFPFESQNKVIFSGGAL